MQGARYDVGFKFTRGWISAAAVTDKMEAERAELIAIILNVAQMMHHIFRASTKSEA